MTSNISFLHCYFTLIAVEMLQSYINCRVSDISDMWLLANWRIESG